MLIGNVGGLRSNEKQVGRFSSLGTVVPYGFLPTSVYFLSPTSRSSESSMKRPYLLKSESASHEGEGVGRTMLEH